MRSAIIFALLLTILGCSDGSQSGKPRTPGKRKLIINVSLKYASTNGLDWVKLVWSGPGISAGILPPGIWKTTLSVEWTNVPSATITFVDDKTRKRYNIDVSLQAANKLLEAGDYHEITFRILDYDKAEVICE